MARKIVAACWERNPALASRSFSLFCSSSVLEPRAFDKAGAAFCSAWPMELAFSSSTPRLRGSRNTSRRSEVRDSFFENTLSSAQTPNVIATKTTIGIHGITIVQLLDL